MNQTLSQFLLSKWSLFEKLSNISYFLGLYDFSNGFNKDFDVDTLKGMIEKKIVT